MRALIETLVGLAALGLVGWGYWRLGRILKRRFPDPLEHDPAWSVGLLAVAATLALLLLLVAAVALGSWLLSWWGR